MRSKFAILVLLIAALCFFSGCMTYDDFVKIDDQVRKVQALEAQAQEKIAQAKAGELTAPEALAWVQQANEQIKDANKEINDLKKGKNIGWAELIGAVAASMLGGTGLVRAWRGPSHKDVSV